MFGGLSPTVSSELFQGECPSAAVSKVGVVCSVCLDLASYLTIKGWFNL